MIVPNSLHIVVKSKKHSFLDGGLRATCLPQILSKDSIPETCDAVYLELNECLLIWLTNTTSPHGYKLKIRPDGTLASTKNHIVGHWRGISASRSIAGTFSPVDNEYSDPDKPISSQSFNFERSRSSYLDVCVQGRSFDQVFRLAEYVIPFSYLLSEETGLCSSS